MPLGHRLTRLLLKIGLFTAALLAATPARSGAELGSARRDGEHAFSRGPAEHAKTQFERYCASCHGATGKGDGPAVPALTKRPPDLTRLKANAGGTFSLSEVMSAIDGRRAIAAHGSRDMPVWGVKFKEALEGKPYMERTTLLTVRELAEYLATIQE